MIITVDEFGTGPVVIADYPYVAGASQTEEQLANEVANNIDALGTGYRAEIDGRILRIFHRYRTLNYLSDNVTATNSVVASVINTTGFFTLEVFPTNLEISWYVTHNCIGNFVTEAANLIEKGIRGNWGDEPARPANLPVDWDSFEALEIYFDNIKGNIGS